MRAERADEVRVAAAGLAVRAQPAAPVDPLRDERVVLQALVDGNMLFAIDQQQYLQGYLPVVMLTLYNQFGGLIPGGGGVVLTGPGFVTAENAAAVIDLSAQGIR